MCKWSTAWAELLGACTGWELAAEVSTARLRIGPGSQLNIAAAGRQLGAEPMAICNGRSRGSFASCCSLPRSVSVLACLDAWMLVSCLPFVLQFNVRNSAKHLLLPLAGVIGGCS